VKKDINLANLMMIRREMGGKENKQEAEVLCN
jgi:hypothetical protein